MGLSTNGGIPAGPKSHKAMQKRCPRRGGTALSRMQSVEVLSILLT